MVKLVTVLVGPPCCGKTTYLDSLLYDAVVSSDNIVEQLCIDNDISYGDYFLLVRDHVLRKQHQLLFKNAVEKSKVLDNVVWDLTNLTVSARSNIFNHYPKAKFNAVVFDFKGKEDLLLSRNTMRAKVNGKHVSLSSFESMFERYEPITPSEAFSLVTVVSVD